LAGSQTPTQTLLQSSSSTDWWEKIRPKKHMGQDKDREITQQLPPWVKKAQLQEKYFITIYNRVGL